MRFYSLVLSCFICGSLYSQTTAQDSAWLYENYYKIERYIKMRDGVQLFTSIMIPKDTSEKHPILIERTPYSCAPYGEKKFNTAYWESYMKYYIREGYIMVKQDVRGRWMSEGIFADVRPFKKDKQGQNDIDEASDT